MATESFHRVLQGQELMPSKTHGVASSHSPDVSTFQTFDHRIFSDDLRTCLFNDAERGLRQRNNTEFPYQPRGFGESIRLAEVLQGQEMSRVVPLYHGNASDACTQNCQVGSSDYVHRPAATQGYSLQRFTPSAAEVCSPSSVFMFNQTMVPQPEFEGTINLQDAASLEQMQRKTEDWPFVEHQMPCVTESNQFELTSTNVGKPGPAGREVGRSSCRLFGFSLTENILAAEEDGMKDGNYTDPQTPRALELFGHRQSTPSALPALCIAPLGL
jgi:auxin response factor